MSAGKRIIPWGQFIGSMIPNWLQCRSELGQGAKLAYARLAQYAGKDGECFPKQKTLGAALGVSERTANEYIRDLVKFRLIEKERLGLGKSNRYFFLDHQWMHENQSDTPPRSGQERQESSAPDRQNPSGQEMPESSVPISKENHYKRESEKTQHTHSSTSSGFPQTLDEALEVARRLGIDEDFARTEFHSKKAVGWKDGYRNPITSWLDHLQARWLTEQRKRAERSAPGRGAGKRPPGPPRQFNSGDYNQPV